MKLFHLLLVVGIMAEVYGQRSNASFPGYSIRNIGPANPGGRVVDIEAQHDDFTKVYVASASGGVWKSVNSGITWQPIFNHYETASIGDLALDPHEPNTIWVGTGEANNRNSVSWGHGIYKSTDGGQTFILKGLQSTHHISRVVVNPKNSKQVCVCATGHLWGYNGDRGLFISQDGGENWSKKVKGLPDDGKTGCTDLVIDPKNPKILYAAYYHRLRKPYHFQSGGEQGGIYKSVDGGESWKKLTMGLPAGPTGRIGLALYDKDPNILMAIIEAEKTDTLSKPGTGIYRTENGGKNWTYLNMYNNRPFYYSQIRINPQNDQRVYVLTTRFMVSDDGGKTLKDGSQDQEVHGDFHALWNDPLHPDRYYLGADKGFSLTHDHGAHFQLMDNLPIAQYYRIGFDHQVPYHVYGGLQDNGSFATASFARDARGILNDQNWKMHWGDGQDAAVNPFQPDDAYTGMENGAYFKYNPSTRELNSIKPAHHNILNFSEHFPDEGNLNDLLRFNWSAPFVLSPTEPSTVYIGGNYLFKSTNKGQSWEIISPDLSSNDPIKRKDGVSGGITPDNTGAETHCTIYSIGVSPLAEDIIWVGTDDGLVQVTTDGGRHWENVRSRIPEVPAETWVSRIEASHVQPGRAYVTFDGHRSDHFDTWVFTTEDYGKSWQKITMGITPGEVMRVIREDVVNPNLLFAGSETGVWYSLNRGQHWSRLPGLPTVSVYDLKIHPEAHDLILATHGRGLWVVDDISPWQQMDDVVPSSPLHLFQQRPTILWNNLSRGGQRGHFWWAGTNPKNIVNTSSLPRADFKCTAPISFYVANGQMDSVQITITDPSEKLVFEDKIKVEQGINRYYWEREFISEPYNDAEKTSIENYFKDHIKKDISGELSPIYQRFQRAENNSQKRRIIQQINTRYPFAALPDRLGLREAGPGTYLIKISFQNHSEVGSVELRADQD